MKMLIKYPIFEFIFFLSRGLQTEEKSYIFLPIETDFSGKAASLSWATDSLPREH